MEAEGAATDWTRRGELAHELARHGRLLHVLKTKLAGQAPAGLDGAAFGLLMALYKCGAARQGELAEFSLLDPSTVSRYVGQLVRAGLVARRADPLDGRAVQLTTTERGQAIAAEARRHRELLIGDLLATWSEDDARALVTLLRRLNDEMESRRDDVWPTVPAAAQTTDPAAATATDQTTDPAAASATDPATVQATGEPADRTSPASTVATSA